jgi:hypothetical protein
MPNTKKGNNVKKTKVSEELLLETLADIDLVTDEYNGFYELRIKNLRKSIKNQRKIIDDQREIIDTLKQKLREIYISKRGATLKRGGE